jgi:hypothetical protein
VEFRSGAMENLGMNRSFWDAKKVFLTGNTGFEGQLVESVVAFHGCAGKRLCAGTVWRSLCGVTYRGLP